MRGAAHDHVHPLPDLAEFLRSHGFDASDVGNGDEQAVQRLADRVSAVFVPTVIVASVATLGLWLATGAGSNAALTAAVTTPGLEAEVKLRKASAARAGEDFDLAAELARFVRSAAEAAGDKELELSACLELGQALSRSPIGEAYIAAIEIDVDEAEEPYNRALDIAREIGARSAEADSLRELSVLEAGRVKRIAVGLQESGVPDIMILMQAPELFAGVKALAEQALRIYEEIGDKQGSMSALISMAYAHVADPSAQGMAGRIERELEIVCGRQLINARK